jgi:hypothetical protein
MIELKELELTDEQLEAVIGGAGEHPQHENNRRDEGGRQWNDEGERHRHRRGHWGWWRHHREWEWDD